MYFPRELIVLSHVLSSFIVMIIGYGVVLAIVAICSTTITWSIFAIIPLLILMLGFVIGYVLIFSALTVYIRDIQYFLATINMIFFFTTPMYFTLDGTGGLLKTIVWFNPFTYFVEVFHDIVYYGQVPNITLILACVFLSITAMILGKMVFGKLKKGFAERL